MSSSSGLPQRDAAVAPTDAVGGEYPLYGAGDDRLGAGENFTYDDDGGIGVGAHDQAVVYSEAVAQNVAVLALVLLIGIDVAVNYSYYNSSTNVLQHFLLE